MDERNARWESRVRRLVHDGIITPQEARQLLQGAADATPSSHPSQQPSLAAPQQRQQRQRLWDRKSTLLTVAIAVMATALVVLLAISDTFDEKRNSQASIADTAREPADMQYLASNDNWELSQLKSQRWQEFFKCIMEGDTRSLNDPQYLTGNPTWRHIIITFARNTDCQSRIAAAMRQCATFGSLDLNKLWDMVVQICPNEALNNTYSEQHEEVPADNYGDYQRNQYYNGDEYILPEEEFPGEDPMQGNNDAAGNTEHIHRQPTQSTRPAAEATAHPAPHPDDPQQNAGMKVPQQTKPVDPAVAPKGSVPLPTRRTTGKPEVPNRPQPANP